MFIKQLSVFVENKHGSLDEIIKILADAGVDESYSVKRSVAALIGAGYSPAIRAF